MVSPILSTPAWTTKLRGKLIRQKSNALYRKVISPHYDTKWSAPDTTCLHGRAEIGIVGKTSLAIVARRLSDISLDAFWRVTMNMPNPVVAGIVAGVSPLSVAVVSQAQSFAGMGPGNGHGMDMRDGHGWPTATDPAAATDARLAAFTAPRRLT